jgi:pyruvate ferredoxin oxidoreductase gamma subunit
VQDPTLIHHVRLLDGVGPDTFVLINTSRTLDELGLGDLTLDRSSNQARCIPATDLAREILGRPLPNTALLGGFAAQTGLVSIEAIASAIRATFASAVAERNVKVAEAAFRFVREAEGRLADA